MIGERTYEVFRQRGEYVAGMWTEKDAPEVFAVRGCLQSLDPKAALILEASSRSTARWTFYADRFQRELLIATPETMDGRGHPGDVLHSGERRFVVTSITAQEAAGSFQGYRSYVLSELGVDTMASGVVE